MSLFLSEQEQDETLGDIQETCKEGVAKPNAVWCKQQGIVYRKYTTKGGLTLGQIVVPSKFRHDLLALSHRYS